MPSDERIKQLAESAINADLHPMNDRTTGIIYAIKQAIAEAVAPYKEEIEALRKQLNQGETFTENILRTVFDGSYKPEDEWLHKLWLNNTEDFFGTRVMLEKKFIPVFETFYKKIKDKATAAERERCAGVCKKMSDYYYDRAVDEAISKNNINDTEAQRYDAMNVGAKRCQQEILALMKDGEAIRAEGKSEG